MVNFHLVSLRYPCFMLCGPIIKKLVWKINCEPKKDSNGQEGHGWMIEDGQLLFDRMSDPRGGGRLLVNCVPMREQRTAKLTLNSVFDILKLIPLFTVSSQKVTLSNVVNLNAYFLTSANFCKICKNIPFSYKIAFSLP